MARPPAAYFCQVTAPQPGAVGIVQLIGDDAGAIAARLCGQTPGPACRLVQFDDIDEGLLVAPRPGWVQLMPHGGVRVMQQITARLIELGATPEPNPPATALYPEANSPIEADMLLALSQAPSPAAIDRLLVQPRVWLDLIATSSIDAETITRHTVALDRLMHPPRVVVVGPANVGKSTLTNQLAGRAASIVADLPGTTRDWVGTLIELPTDIGDLAVHWIDTPGLRNSTDAIERRAIELARSVIASADLLIAMRDDEQDWPTLPREPDLWVVNKADRPATAELLGRHPAAIGLTAREGRGIDTLARAITCKLGLSGLTIDTPWAFCKALKDGLNRPGKLRAYLAADPRPRR